MKISNVQKMNLVDSSPQQLHPVLLTSKLRIMKLARAVSFILQAKREKLDLIL